MDPNTQQLIRGANSGSALGPIEFVSTRQIRQGNNSITINKPAGVQQDDLLIVFCCSINITTWTGDSGWTEVLDQGSARPSVRVAYKVAGASEPTSYTFTAQNSGGEYSVVIVVFRNAAYDAIGSLSTTASSGVQTAPAVTLSTGSSAVLAYFANDQASRTWSNESSGLVSTATQSSTQAPCMALYRELSLSSGSTGTRQATCSGGGGSFGCVLVGIKPA